jgi:hypothetical protein
MINTSSDLFVIIHAWSLLVEVFFKGVHLEFEKNTYSYLLSMLDNSFYRLCFRKIFTPPLFPQLIPSHIKLNACSFTHANVYRFLLFHYFFFCKDRNTGFSSRHLLRLQKFCMNSRFRTGIFWIQ